MRNAFLQLILESLNFIVVIKMFYNLSNVSREAIRHFRNKKREYLKDKINELESISKNKNIRDLYSSINEFKKSYQPRTNLVKDEKGDLLTDPHKL
jgi:hypothetical protein